MRPLLKTKLRPRYGKEKAENKAETAQSTEKERRKADA